MSIQEARETIRKSFENDPDFRRGYQDNIAMLLHDRHGITEYDARNAAADDILKLIFESNSEQYLSPQMEILLEAMGEASALFMSQPIIGTKLVMPEKELTELARRTDTLLQQLDA